MPQENEPRFEGGFHIWPASKGRGRPKLGNRGDPDGWVSIGDGRLTLHGSGGAVITEGPIRDLRVRGLHKGHSARIWIGGESYLLGPLPPGAAEAVPLIGLYYDYQRMKEAAEMTKLFLAAVEAEGGHVENP